MTQDQLIAVQGLVLVLVIIIMLVVLLFRQRKTIRTLQDALTTFRDELSGVGLQTHLQKAIDTTLANSQQGSLELRSDLATTDLATALRYGALQSELAIIANNTTLPWREQIQAYEAFALDAQNMLRKRIEQVTQSLNDEHNHELAGKDKSLQEQHARHEALEKKLNSLKPLQDLIENVTDLNAGPLEIERKLHFALLDICNNQQGTEKLREVVSLLHEAFVEAHQEEPQ